MYVVCTDGCNSTGGITKLVSRGLNKYSVFGVTRSDFSLSGCGFIVVNDSVHVKAISGLVAGLLFQFVGPLSREGYTCFLAYVFPRGNSNCFGHGVPSRLLDRTITITTVNNRLSFGELHKTSQFTTGVVLGTRHRGSICGAFSLSASGVSSFISGLGPRLWITTFTATPRPVFSTFFILRDEVS